MNGVMMDMVRILNLSVASEKRILMFQAKEILLVTDLLTQFIPTLLEVLHDADRNTVFTFIRCL